MMQTIKPKDTKWSDSTFVEITITPSYGEADFIRTISEDAMLHAAKNSKAYADALSALRQLYENELIECDHSYTEIVAVDDDRWLEPDGVHERSNPDETRCLICGATYNQKEETWENY